MSLQHPAISWDLENHSAQEILAWAIGAYGDRFAVSTSFQSEGMVLVDMAARISKQVRVITLDTGRLPAATHEMIDIVRARYGIAVEIIAPDASEVERMVTTYGTNLFYRDPDWRLLCCQIRKVRPLARKLAEFDAYAVGLRRSQTADRAAIAKVDTALDPIKLSPLADWSPAQVEAYTLENDVPRHPLYARGYTSIGCDPCTRAVAEGEAERAGRWWWEDDLKKECGLHFGPDGVPRRALDILVNEITSHA